MSEPNFTPAPWFSNGLWDIQSNTGISGTRDNGEPIPELPNIIAKVLPGRNIANRVHNAHLIADQAAQEFISYLRDFTPDEPVFWESWENGSAEADSLAKLRAALAKAEGGAQ